MTFPVACNLFDACSLTFLLFKKVAYGLGQLYRDLAFH